MSTERDLFDLKKAVRGLTVGGLHAGGEQVGKRLDAVVALAGRLRSEFVEREKRKGAVKL
jgi:hypothetical protein